MTLCTGMYCVMTFLRQQLFWWETSQIKWMGGFSSLVFDMSSPSTELLLTQDIFDKETVDKQSAPFRVSKLSVCIAKWITA